MKKLNAVGWFDIYINNMEKSVSFYEAVLDTKLEAIKDPTGETEMMSFSADMANYGSGGALVRSDYAKPGPGGTVVYFNVDDCKVNESKVESAGGKIIRPKFSIGEFGWITICQDPDGNIFGLNSMS